MADEDKKPPEKKKWGFKMPDLSSAIKGVTDAAKVATDKAKAVGKEASIKAAEVAKAGQAKAAEIAKEAQDKLKKDKPQENKDKPQENKDKPQENNDDKKVGP